MTQLGLRIHVIPGFTLPHYLIFLKSLYTSIPIPERALHTALPVRNLGYCAHHSYFQTVHTILITAPIATYYI